MFTRPFGHTEIELSAVGFGGIICRDEDASEARSVVVDAIDRGVNYFDIAPAYGNAQYVLGPALAPFRRDVFLACKTGARDADGAERDLNESLNALKTDYFDLYQLHGVTTSEEVEQIFAPGGAMELFERAKAEERIRYLGFSAHSEEAAIQLMERYDFTSVLFPINWVTWNTGRFGPRVIAAADETATAVLALKSLAKRKWRDGEERIWPKCWYRPIDTIEEARLAFRFTMSRPVTAAVCPGHKEFLHWACDAADDFTQLSEDEEQEVVERARNEDTIFASVTR